MGQFINLVIAVWSVSLCLSLASAQLRQNYYANVCPNVENVVRNAVKQKFQQTFVTVPATLRLFFHDCFVQGCDASVIISSSGNNKAEKDHPDNLSLAGDGFDTVIKAKAAVDAIPSCRNKVSCADILAMATRDVVALSGGPSYAVELGRLDGLSSTAASVNGKLPHPGFNLNQLNSMFAAHGLSQTDMIALSGMTSKILEKKRFLTDIADEDGWTPLHYAAHFNHVKMVRLLLKQEKSAAYTPNKEGKTALHIAASRGNTESMQELVSECPDCCELVDGRGKNALHVAVENNEGGSVGLMLKNPLFGSLINEKDVDGNTPLHLLATWGCYIRSLIIEPRVDKSAYNAENLTALDIASCTHQFSTLKSLVRRDLALAGAKGGLRKVINKDEGEKGDTAREHLKKVGETHLIVAALIATVTFTAGFTLPGGNSNNMGPIQGDAIFTRQAAFKAFFVTDTVAMVLSTSAVFIYFITALYANQTKLFNRVIWAFCLTILAMGAMVLAFVTGTYATLGNPSGLAIATCVVGCCFFLVNFFVLRKLYLDKISRRSRLCGNCHGHGHGVV